MSEPENPILEEDAKEEEITDQQANVNVDIIVDEKVENADLPASDINEDVESAVQKSKEERNEQPIEETQESADVKKNLDIENQQNNEEQIDQNDVIKTGGDMEHVPDNVSEKQAPDNNQAETTSTDVNQERGDGQENTNSIKSPPEATENQEMIEDEEEDTHPLDELTDQQLIDLVQEMETENRHLKLENNLFLSFLEEKDPSLLEGLDDIMNYLLSKDSTALDTGKEPSERHSIIIDKNKYRLDSYTSITSIAQGKGPKINLPQKTDMVMRAMEESQSNLEAFLKKSHIIKRNLKSELEEFSIREAEIKEASEIFEYNVVLHGVDKLTQRIPAEKFIRYMEEWLKSAQLQIEKLRLRIATLKVQFKKVSQQLIQRQELGENVHAVDFDQLEIENKHFIEKIEQKNIHLIELKKMNGGANLVLSTHKKFLQKQQEDCNKLKHEIDEIEKQIELTDKEYEIAEEELQIEVDKYEQCKDLKNQYTVPEVTEYVQLKAKLHELRKNIKIWTRRRKIQDIALNTCIREMKNLTGRVDIDPAWFDEVLSISDRSVSEEMLI